MAAEEPEHEQLGGKVNVATPAEKAEGVTMVRFKFKRPFGPPPPGYAPPPGVTMASWRSRIPIGPMPTRKDYTHAWNGPPRLVMLSNNTLRDTSLSVPDSGLRNFGNTCYINGLLQLLAQSSGFVQDLAQAKASGLLAHLSLEAQHFVAIVLALADQDSTAAFKAPEQFLQWLQLPGGTPKERRYRDSFQPGQAIQQDAHEFLHFVDDILEGHVVRSIHFISELRRNCTLCRHSYITNRAEPQLSMLLPFPPADGPHQLRDLQEAYGFFKIEPLVQWKCVDEGVSIGDPRCPSQIGSKEELLQSAADVMIVLNRFGTDVTGLVQHKVNDKVDLPQGTFDLNHGIEGLPVLRYYIKAVLHHEGLGNDSGHYFTFVRQTSIANDSQARSTKLDDALVQMNQDWDLDVNTSGAYMILCCPA